MDKILLQRYLANLSVAWTAILANKLRAALTALGIIFGVSAVIAMLAIGNGAQQEILEQIKLVGVNNIVIEAVVPKPEEQSEGSGANPMAQEKKTRFSSGLSLKDVESIAEFVPSVQRISPEIVLDKNLVYKGLQLKTKMIGVTPTYFEMYNFQLAEGYTFKAQHLDYGSQVCIIGRGVQAKLFSGEDPIGKRLKCGHHWLLVIGVLEPRLVSENSQSNLGIRDYNMDIYTPIKTVLLRYENRAQVNAVSIRRAEQESEENSEKEQTAPPKNYHQIDRLVVQVAETETLSKTAEVISRMLQRRHYQEVDFEITIPELLLKQQQRTKDIFNLVLGVIAGISLLVGGIGIMNIMLASVLERIKEIGLRLAIGARKADIVMQFMFEAILISVSGGLIGVLLGITMAYAISEIAEIPTIISSFSILVSFLVSASVGLIFGIAPARRAAKQDPITSLRYE